MNLRNLPDYQGKKISIFWLPFIKKNQLSNRLYSKIKKPKDERRLSLLPMALKAI